MKFKLGDIVYVSDSAVALEAIAERSGLFTIRPGLRGKIVALPCNVHAYGVEFDCRIFKRSSNAAFEDADTGCHGKGKMGHCAYLPHRVLSTDKPVFKGLLDSIMNGEGLVYDTSRMQKQLESFVDKAGELTVSFNGVTASMFKRAIIVDHDDYETGGLMGPYEKMLQLPATQNSPSPIFGVVAKSVAKSQYIDLLDAMGYSNNFIDRYSERQFNKSLADISRDYAKVFDTLKSIGRAAEFTDPAGCLPLQDRDLLLLC